MKASNIFIRLFFLLFVFNTIHFSACNEDKNTFTEGDYKVIDSLYNLKKKKFKTRLDTICDSVYQAEYPILVDSIKAIRKKEILELLNN